MKNLFNICIRRNQNFPQMLNLILLGAVIGLYMSYSVMREDELRRKEFVKPDETVEDLLDFDWMQREEVKN